MSVAARALHGINTCLLPSDANDNRPLALRHKPLAVVSASLLAIKALAILATILTPTPAQLATITANRVIQLTNQERVNAGLEPLKENSALSAAAKDKGNHMLEQDYFAHISPTGVTPWFWIQKHGYDYSVAGENLAIDFVEVEDVVAAWMASPSHRDNILHPDYTETGVAVVTGEFQGGTSTIVVHTFGRPATATLPSSTPTPTPTPQAAGTQQTATPTPTATPSPIPTPIEEEPAPPAPRIAIVGSTTIQNELQLSVDSTPDTTLTVLANGTTLISEPTTEETTILTLDVSDIDDGDITVQAYATGSPASPLSNTITVTKDTTGPEVATSDLTFVLSPLFDHTQAAAVVPHSDQEELKVFSATAPVTIEVTDELGNSTLLSDITLSPVLDETVDPATFSAPNRANQLSRRITGITFIVLLTLLLLAIVIRIRVQHPALITHASFVILLAGILFFV